MIYEIKLIKSNIEVEPFEKHMYDETSDKNGELTK